MTLTYRDAKKIAVSGASTAYFVHRCEILEEDERNAGRPGGLRPVNLILGDCDSEALQPTMFVTHEAIIVKTAISADWQCDRERDCLTVMLKVFGNKSEVEIGFFSKVRDNGSSSRVHVVVYQSGDSRKLKKQRMAVVPCDPKFGQK